MAWFKDGERTEPATPKKKEEARKRGQVAKSREVPTAFLVLFSAVCLYLSGGVIGRFFVGIAKLFIAGSSTLALTGNSVVSIGIHVARQSVMAFMPLILTMVLVSSLSNFLQVGFLFTTKPIEPDLSRIDPISGFGRLISPEAFFEVFKSLIKILAVGYVGYRSVKPLVPEFSVLSQASTWDIFKVTVNSILRVCFHVGIFLCVLALIDYLYQRHRYNENLKMTKEEVKEEFKEREGDPMVRARIRSLQRQLARRRMMEKVKEADVVITNPTHIAVALKYEMGKMDAPQVVAKGAGFIAERIKEVARRFGVVVVEDKPLAQLIYKMVDVGGFIPPVLYKAVAKILAYVYQLKGRRITA